MKEIWESHENREKMTWKPNVTARLANLPICPELTRTRVPRAGDVGRFLSFSGTVIRVTTVKMLEFEREFACTKCKHVFAMQAQFEQGYTIPKPTRCPSDLDGEGCDGVKFRCLNDGSIQPTSCRDYQVTHRHVGCQTLSTVQLGIWIGFAPSDRLLATSPHPVLTPVGRRSSCRSRCTSWTSGQCRGPCGLSWSTIWWTRARPGTISRCVAPFCGDGSLSNQGSAARWKRWSRRPIFASTMPRTLP